MTLINNNVNHHIIPSYCHLQVSCRSLEDQCTLLGAVSQIFNFVLFKNILQYVSLTSIKVSCAFLLISLFVCFKCTGVDYHIIFLLLISFIWRSFYQYKFLLFIPILIIIFVIYSSTAYHTHVNCYMLTLRMGEGSLYFCSHSPDKISQIHTLLSVDALTSLCPFLDQLVKQNRIKRN